MEKKKRALTMKQEMFVQAYCDLLNATRAYMKVYGVSEDVAGTAAARLLGNVRIQERIEELRKYTSGKHNITRERIIKRLAALAFPDTRSLYDEGGRLKQMHELTEEQAAVIEGLETLEETDREGIKIGDIRKVKLSSQRAAIDSLTKLLGFNEPDKIKQEVLNNFPGGVLQIVVVPAPEGSKGKEL